MRILIAPLTATDKRTARFTSGFGCIRCATTVFHYCLADAGAPASEAFLLCPVCLAALNQSDNSIDVIEAMRANPMPRQQRLDRSDLPYQRAQILPDVRFANGAVMRETAIPIIFGDAPVLGLSTPEVDGGPVQLSITLGGADGVPVQLVAANEWVGPTQGWHFAHQGPRYLFCNDSGEARLALLFPSDGEIAVEELRTQVGARQLIVDGLGARVDTRPVSLPPVSAKLVGVTI